MGIFGRRKKTDPSKASVSSPRVSDYLTEKNIAFFSAGPSKRQVFGSLISHLDLPDPSSALKAILAREEAGSTVITPGLALPHARITGIPTIQAALGICPTGVHYTSKAEEPVRLILLFLGPAENMREHLAFLAGASALFQVKGLPDKLIHLTSAKAVSQAIQEAEKNF